MFLSIESNTNRLHIPSTAFVLVCSFVCLFVCLFMTLEPNQEHVQIPKSENAKAIPWFNPQREPLNHFTGLEKLISEVLYFRVSVHISIEISSQYPLATIIMQPFHIKMTKLLSK